ncbi:MAG: protein kinase [Polyangiaceae bacterium]|nr:protein kinase [Polyangiaceae bacterium]
MNPERGVILGGKYRVERRLAEGAMGAVYEGRHLELGRRVALKFADVRGGATVARFYREARIAGTLESDYVVQVFDVGTDDRHGVYMVLEYLEGEDLDARLTREKKLHLPSAVTLASHIARGISKAHSRGIVHRDLKPANVFLCTRDDGATVAKVLDFGVSKVVDHESQRDLNGPVTEFDLAVGTPMYMAPEQAAAPSEVDQRADVFALGAILFEMLAGRTCFDTESVPADRLLSHILLRKAPPLHTVAPWVPAALAGFVDEMLSHDRDARPRNGTRVLERLGALYPNLSLPTPTVVLAPASQRGRASGADDTVRAAALTDAVLPTPEAFALSSSVPPAVLPPDAAELAATPAPGLPSGGLLPRPAPRFDGEDTAPQVRRKAHARGPHLAWLAGAVLLAVGTFWLGRTSLPKVAAAPAEVARGGEPAHVPQTPSCAVATAAAPSTKGAPEAATGRSVQPAVDFNTLPRSPKSVQVARPRATGSPAAPVLHGEEDATPEAPVPAPSAAPSAVRFDEM